MNITVFGSGYVGLVHATVLALTLIHKYCELIGTFPDFQDLISYVTPEHGNDHANFCSSSCGRLG
ncbi:hypothetical protein GWQ22_02000 [Aeromonas sp. 1HA1]|nr:hypothetical protein [Aeromonas sp. 1HA1]